MPAYSVYHIHAGSWHDNGYIGITKNPELRFQQHGWKRKKTNAHLRNAINKYKEALCFDVLATNLDFEAACLLESMLRPMPEMGWNIAAGGSVPPNPAGKERSLKYRKNIAKAKMGEANPMYGRKLTFSLDHKKRLSDAARSMKPLTCPHCGVSATTNGMKRWHFDRCKNASI